MCKICNIKKVYHNHILFTFYIYVYIILYVYMFSYKYYIESYSVGVPQFVKTGVPGTMLKRLFILGILGRKYKFPRLVFLLKL